MVVENLVVDSVLGAGKLTAKAVTDTWSVMDAAAEKPAPSKLLGQKAISSIQGASDHAQKGINSTLAESR
jgi:hypothetical protein